jgi:L-alanine-DL-glutamate epimerase-like enolase superfamily enzyme
MVNRKRPNDRGEMAASGRPATKIERVEVYGYVLTYAHGDYVMSGGRVVNELDSTVVRIVTAGGIDGFGETCPLGSTYLPAHAEGARAALAVLAPALIGEDAANLAAVHERMELALSGSVYAKSAVDVACFDALGKSADVPVSTLLGGQRQDRLPLYVAVPLGPPDEMQAFVARERDGGVHHFQLKIGGRPEDDIERVAAVLESTGPEDALIADANGGWHRQDAIIAARAFESLPSSHRLRLEQPCPTLEECLAVRAVTDLPMVLDEVIVDVPTLLRAVDANAMDHINLKVSRVGGLTLARAIRDAAVELGLRLTIEDSWGGDIVTATVSHLAAAVPPDQLFAVSFMNDWTVESVAGGEPRSNGGWGPINAGPGLGISVETDMLGEPLLVAD